MQRDDVGGAIQGGEVDIARADTRPQFRILLCVECQNLTAKAVKDPSRNSPDLPGADDPYCLAMQVEPDEALKRKVPVADARISAMELPIERQDQRHRMLRHRVG